MVKSLVIADVFDPGHVLQMALLARGGCAEQPAVLTG